MNILLISPYHGGSHRAWAEGYAKASEHKVHILNLPDKDWQWRMRMAAWEMAAMTREWLKRMEDQLPDVILATDMLDLATYLSLMRDVFSQVPSVLYMHENQWVYPVIPNKKNQSRPDRSYAHINLNSMLVADQVWFNSAYHQACVSEAIKDHMAKQKQSSSVTSMNHMQQRLMDRSSVMHVGVDLQRFDTHLDLKKSNQVPMILWNQRWTYDKNPRAMYHALKQLADEELRFHVTLCGETQGAFEQELYAFAESHPEHVVHCGWLDQDSYIKRIVQADIVLSTAYHEYFGISVVEASYCGATPIVPHRVSYPEVLDASSTRFYYNSIELVTQLRDSIEHRYKANNNMCTSQRNDFYIRYDWSGLASEYDKGLKQCLDTYQRPLN